eukprot:TRINITY_DN22624_c0_g1_i1.p1 TRINITY_DN22624_c0_g1~~TRINITY_DN22624_c0_g1_i1.p1  ORF type:complete len:150 (-),score=26.58 TRINITY_DN22624_c0_g1_i1:1380-1805(-)
MTTLSLPTASGLASSSLSGQKLAVSSARSVSMKAAPRKVGVATAKYGEKSVYFDLGDIESTTGQWDLYGSDGPSPYNGLQSKFFEIFAGLFTKRGLLLKFLVLGAAGSVGYLGATTSGEVLPIKKGPQGSGEQGPEGSGKI